MRIAVVTETFPPEVNGVAATAARFAAGLASRGHVLEVIRPRQAIEPVRPFHPDIREVAVRGVPIPRYPGLRLGLPAARFLARRWRIAPPDVVHVVTEGPLGWSALRAARTLGLPVVSDFRTNFHAYGRHYGLGWLTDAIASYLRRFHNATRLTLVPTEALRQDLAARGFHNLRVVARGVDAELFHPGRRNTALRAAWGADADTCVFIHVGRLAPEKNLGVLVAAREAIAASGRPTRLVIVGDGPADAQLRRQLPDAIFAGRRAGADLAAHYASADVFLFPSLTETFGNVTLEAMASGLAVVAYDYAAARELVADDFDGRLVPYDDALLFSAAAAALALDAGRVARLRRMARETALRHDWERVVSHLEDALFATSRAGTAARVIARTSDRVEARAPSLDG